ncbi:NAD(P)/FAD-dependent oxidoreductase [Amycolatopsis sp. NPDC005232]|uniref:flavin-containing monooxygenase n=1 Tax=Amycolatopsis sp. NPDC005232 TaxID=3157027 RepID=UPI0033A5A71B
MSTPDTVAVEQFEKWLERFAGDIGSGDARRVAEHFRDDGYLRDILALTWDFRTFAGPAEIESAFATTLPEVRLRDLRRSPERLAPRIVRRSGRSVLEAYFDFDTVLGRGSAFVRLQLADGDDTAEDPRVWTLLTTLQELRGFEERVLDRRPDGTEFSYQFAGDNWLDTRLMRAEFTDRQPEVLIVGAGQAGLSLGARLGQIGVDALIVESNARVGDNWRNRYHSLALHNEVWSNHMPYVPFPPNWPTFLPKDKLAGFLEAYTEFMELNVWTGTQMMGADYDETNKHWTVRLKRADGVERLVTVPHLVMATGSVAGAPIVPKLPGLDEFAGEVLHSSEFTSGVPYRDKRAIVIGTGNSGHDVAQDLYSNDATEVTIVQRGSTCVVSLVPSGTMVYSLYAEGPVEDIDLITASIPYPELRSSYQWLTKKTCELDKALLDGLRAVGFETDMGEDGTGFHMKYLRTGGGYYINVGCSDLIARRKIKLAHASDIETFVRDGLRRRDGTVIQADVVVLATGFETQVATIRRLLGDEVADRIGELWGFDDDGFMKNMWRPTGQERLWVMGGALAECRLWSRFLALQIKADLEGLRPAWEGGRPGGSPRLGV